MKTLTIKEPYATLIINGIKKYEFRTWKTNYRGKLLIHAGLSTDNTRMKELSTYNLKYNNGNILGEVTLVDCILVDELMDALLNKENPLVYGKDHVGIYAWKLSDPIIYDNPIPVKGKLGLWNYNDMK